MFPRLATFARLLTFGLLLALLQRYRGQRPVSLHSAGDLGDFLLILAVTTAIVVWFGQSLFLRTSLLATTPVLSLAIVSGKLPMAALLWLCLGYLALPPMVVLLGIGAGGARELAKR